MSDTLYKMIAEMVDRGEPGALATVIGAERSAPRHAGSKMIVRVDGTTEGSVGGGGLEARVIEQARAAIDDGECRRVSFDLKGKDGVCGGDVDVFVEPILTRAPLVIIGLGHVGRALLDLGAELPYRFIAIDDRPEFLADLDGVETRLAAIEPDGGGLVLGDAFRPGPRTIVLACNRSHELDGQALEAVFEVEEAAGVECGYIGMVGSRRKAVQVAKRFAGNPRRAGRFTQVQTPVGLAIGAETPHEIALSILAEIMAMTRDVPVCEATDGAQAAVWRMRYKPVTGKASGK